MGCSSLTEQEKTVLIATFFNIKVTGSGKTYTMTGKPTPDGTGILPRTLDVIFNSIDNKYLIFEFFFASSVNLEL